jgi:putative transposase
MRRRRHTSKQVIRKLAEVDMLVDQDQYLERAVRHLDITELALHRWKNKNCGIRVDDSKSLKALQDRNWRLN